MINRQLPISEVICHDDDEEGLAGLVPVDHIIAAVLVGAITVLAGFGWWIHHTFIVPSQPRRTP